MSALTECKGYISSNSKYCLSTCNSLNSEFSISFANFKKCVVCTDYYTSNEDITKATCSTSCDSATQLKMIPARNCIAKAVGCSDLILSFDGTSCDAQCDYPDIKKGSVCVKEDSCTGDGLIIDETGSSITCASTTGGYSCSLKSSDGKRCVSTCISIKEAEPAEGSNQCQTCVSP